MRSTLRTVGGFVFAFFISAASANAAVITFNLNCELGSHGCTSITPSAGTVTLTDNGNVVDVSFNLTTGDLVHSVYLNYDPAKFTGSTAFIGDISNDPNNQKADGWEGKFDLKSPISGNVDVNPYLFTLAVAGVDLDPMDFVFRDTEGLFYVALHTVAGGNYFGSTALIDPDPDPDPDPSVPEPATVLLLGVGLAATIRSRSRARR